LFSQFPMCFQAAKKSDALGQSGKQVQPILSEPSVKSVLR
jgi:hypothetical protein